MGKMAVGLARSEPDWRKMFVRRTRAI